MKTIGEICDGCGKELKFQMDDLSEQGYIVIDDIINDLKKELYKHRQNELDTILAEMEEK